MLTRYVHTCKAGCVPVCWHMQQCSGYVCVMCVCMCMCAHVCVNGHSGQCSSGHLHVFLSEVMTVLRGPRPAQRWAFPGFTLVGLACPGARPILGWAVPSPPPCHQSYPSQQATRLPPLLAKFGSLCSAAISGSQSHGGAVFNPARSLATRPHRPGGPRTFPCPPCPLCLLTPPCSLFL